MLKLILIFRSLLQPQVFSVETTTYLYHLNHKRFIVKARQILQSFGFHVTAIIRLYFLNFMDVPLNFFKKNQKIIFWPSGSFYTPRFGLWSILSVERQMIPLAVLWMFNLKYLRLLKVVRGYYAHNLLILNIFTLVRRKSKLRLKQKKLIFCL